MEENKESHTHSHEDHKPSEMHEHKPAEHGAAATHHVHAQHSEPKPSSSFLKNHLWKLTTGILAVALIISLLLPGFGGGGIGATEAGNKAVATINNELQGQATASLLSVNEQNGLYNAKIDLQGQILDTYITKDGSLLFPQAIEISDLNGNSDSNNGVANNNGNAGTVVRKDVNIENTNSIGEEDAPITIVEFSDFQCPFCARFFTQTLPQIEKEYIETGKVRLIFMHFPLNSIHPNAEPAALASECAGEQGKFWGYHDLLFENQGALEASNLKQYAADLKLNEEQFNDCLDSKKYKDKVDSELNEGSKNGVSGTPAFFINGRLLSGAQPFSAFQDIIEQELGNKPIQGPATPINQPAQPQGKADVDIEGAYFIGEEDAEVTVVEFSDFQCPFCKKSFDDSVKNIKKDFVESGKVKFVYMHFPLSFHPEAAPAAEASECAGEQGKFWEYHDKLFENQGRLSSAYYTELAGELSLDESKFSDCIESGKYTGKVTSQTNAGQGYGVSGTPTFFINGKKLVGAQPYTTIKSAIEAEL